MRGVIAQAEAGLSLAQRFRIARARSQRLLAREWDESKHPRVPAGSGDPSGQFAESGSGSAGTAATAKPKGKGKKATKADFDKAKISLSVSNEADFIERWNEKIGIEPEEFKKGFMGGVDGTMSIGSSSGYAFEVSGQIEGTGSHKGEIVGNFRREIDVDHKKAYSAYFSINQSSTKSSIGKKILAGNVETYEKLGIEEVRVSANIDVGGYAWAKYGYVPTQESWNDLRARLETKLTGGSGGSSRSGNTMEADSWDQLGTDQQADVRSRWMDESRDEFLSSEINHWREDGGAKDDAKASLAYDFEQDDFIPDWADEALNEAREKFDKPIPYSNQQLFAAIDLDYKADGEGRDDPDISFDDDKLRDPKGVDPAQQTLPGIEPEDLAQRLTEKMREEITTRLIHGFDVKVDAIVDEMDPPDYISDSVTEYQEQYWEEKTDDEKLGLAVNYGLADIELPEPEEEEEELDLPKPEADPLLAALRSSDPKSIWAVADSPRGKELLLGRNWSGKLNLKDTAAMARFKEYVGRAKHA